MSANHAIVWIDSKFAHVLKFNARDVEEDRIGAHSRFHKVHHKAGVIGSGHPDIDRHFFAEVVSALGDTQEWLLSGPGQAKDQLLHHLEGHAPRLKERLLGVEASDHPSDAELVDHARRFFKRTDRLRPNSPVPPR